ncbi:MAG: phosphatidate cytidylyltransferase [Planctomycetaceae bacterium]|nr:phosphatidate cytidylyltransferase [Planctomycetaceae bacterium]
MLRTRLLVSAILVPAFIGLCWLDARTGRFAAILMPLAILMAIQASRELAGLLRLGTGSMHAATVGSVAVLLTLWGWHAITPGTSILSRPRQEAVQSSSPDQSLPDGRGSEVATLAPLGPVALAFTCVVLFLLFVRAVSFRGPAGHAGIVAAEVFVVSYVGVLLAMAAELRWIGGGRLGYLALGSLVIGAKVGDIGGYTFGRLFGKRKLAPLLSPGKTRAGAVGAVLTASVATALWLHFTGRLFDLHATIGSWPQLLVIGAMLGVVGLIGDLCESLIKRDAGMKDASHLMPAFGGLLDLIDSILYTAPITLLIWTVWPPVW